MTIKCSHLDQAREVTPSANGCEECLQIGDRWVHLRMCLVCGHVGCYDSSKNKHATKHFHATGHPIMQSAEPGESWQWVCPKFWATLSVGCQRRAKRPCGMGQVGNLPYDTKNSGRTRWQWCYVDQTYLPFCSTATTNTLSRYSGSLKLTWAGSATAESSSAR